jgi:hypothetical protein
MALLTLPALLVFSGLGDPFMSKSFLRWLAPLCIWLAAWFFATVAVNERIMDERNTPASE